MISLYLDTSVAKQAKVTIKRDSEIITEKTEEAPLVAIDKALKEANLEIKDIDDFSANAGPGSYTGLRLGATVINTINWFTEKKKKLIEPIYE